jgi:type II secretory pathway component GspD/PulD (secretin)
VGVAGDEAADVGIGFDPAEFGTPLLAEPLARPYFLPIISSVSLAQILVKRASGPVDGFVVEAPLAGGHNAPPRGAARFDDSGQPLYGPRDEVDLQKLRELGRPFWLAGSRGRLLVTGPADRLRDAADALAFLDVPTPQVLVEVALVETVSHGRVQTGGHGRFDRDASGPDTFFRAFRADFEPTSWLRQELVGGRAFEGADVRGATTERSGTFAGTLDAVLRGMAHDGCADLLARPRLVCTEGVPARMSSMLLLPATLFVQQGVLIQRTTTNETAGVSLEVTAELVGRDAVRLKLHPWVRRVEEASSETGPASYPVLASREVTTTVEVRDGETVIVAGLDGRRRVRDRRGWPALDRLPAIDGLLSSRQGEEATTDLHLLLTVRILEPGREAPAIVPPGEPARLAAKRRTVDAPRGG